ncbi:carbon starvation protein A [Chakrabartyella piscis]|uniref:carbon starvation CstA family protein n=1 Tax=Chakrabartyella piscis TaxID=2918914 RepID=UPI00295846E4|nr:carbon starvation protein A [Chakrabartyella piscis]
MSSLALLAIGTVVLVIGYLTYGKWLAKEWGVDPKIETPAHTEADGKDYVPASAPVLLGHHFASIAGAGPINGPIQAAIFGWVPVLLWILIGGIFFGAVQDFSSLFASIRHKGKSIGYVIEENMGAKAKKLFLLFAYITLLLVVAAFASIVVGTFAGFDATGAQVPANGSTATISVLFIIVAIIFGALVYRKNAPLSIATVVGVAAIILCIVVGLKCPIFLSSNTWLVIVLIYIFIASVTPVWILLQPRDYLNSFLLYGMMIAAFVGVIGSNPTIELPAFTGFMSTTGSTPMFPMLFITVACGAISGFHSLVGSGTTSKQLNNEKDAKVIGYGGMLIECGLALIALITVGVLYADGAMPSGTPTQIFATGIATMISNLGFANAYDTAYAVIILAVSAFCLTSLDTATRLARYMFQEFFVPEGTSADDLTGIQKTLANPYVATLITVVIGGAMAVGGYAKIWPLFGAANQLLAALALLAVAAWLGNISKNNKMFLFPMCFMMVATICSLFITFKANLTNLTAGTGTASTEGLQIVFIILLLVLAINLAMEGYRVLTKKH